MRTGWVGHNDCAPGIQLRGGGTVRDREFCLKTGMALIMEDSGLAAVLPSEGGKVTSE